MRKEEKMFDSVIIGAGVAGSVAARELAESGRSVLVLEQTISEETATTSRTSMEY